jgi:hypothetical protein
VFDTIHDAESPQAFAEALTANAAKFSGTAGPAFIRRIAEVVSTPEGIATFKTALASRRDAFIKALVPPGSAEQVGRVAGRLGLIAAAGEAAALLGIVPWPVNEATRGAAACFRVWLADRGGSGSGEEIDALDRVRTFLQTNEDRFAIALSTRPAVRAGSDDLWDWAEKTLGDAATGSGVSFSVQPGEGAFYGPKLEFALRDRLGRSWQCGTIQLDCVLPARLDAFYIAPDGSRAVPLMIHHAVFGSLGRFIAILLEHHGGALPFWLSPEQVAVAPIAQEQADYAAEVMDMFEEFGLRAVSYSGAETLSRRIVAAHEAEVPVMAILGRREKESRTVTLRERDGAQSTLSWADAATALSSRR